MISLYSKNLTKIHTSHGLTESEMKAQSKKLQPFLKKIQKRNQGFYTVIDDKEMVSKINAFAAKKKTAFDYIVVLGIGGSALGTICLQQSLQSLFENELPQRKHPRLHVLDNIDPSLLTEIEDIIDLKRTLFLVVTKSGTTPETLAQYFYFRKKCEDKRLKQKEHFVFITDPQKGVLREIAHKEGVEAFDVPQNVGGRFSVLTPVGLLPAKCIGIDIEKLLMGARAMRDQFLNKKYEKNMPFQLATMQYLLAGKGKCMNVIMPYAQKLIRFADWYRQLLAESIGKERNEKGKKVHVGLTPINALGVTDQHSQSQLYNEGPNDKFFLFIQVENMGNEVHIPHWQNLSFNQLIHAEMEGTIQSLTQNNRPNITLIIDKIDEYHLGELFMLMQGATAFLGEFYGINAFDQPGVELSKNFTKDMLKNRISSRNFCASSKNAKPATFLVKNAFQRSPKS